jgi:hypothetical protein
MKKIFSWMLIALVGIAFCSCEGFGKKQTEYYLSDLQGKWLEDGTQHFVRFTTESAASLKSGYLWGYEWDEAEDVQEQDVKDDQYGNGWFMYQLDKDELLEINKMNQGWADIPKVYTITVLTNQKLTYHLKDYKNEKVSFTKQ